MVPGMSGSSKMRFAPVRIDSNRRAVATSDPCLLMTTTPAEPAFSVEIVPPDLTPWRNGNTGVPYFHSFATECPGPHLLVTAVVHGNEPVGAIVLDRLLRDPPNLLKGRLTLGFVNAAACAQFDPAWPWQGRYLDEDLNRVWSPQMLDGRRRSIELDRAREIRPMVDRADLLLDLHSMQADDTPLMLAGPLDKGRRFARALGYPKVVVADAGHAEGTRLRDYGGFADPASPKTALLVECGQHWARKTVAVAEKTVGRLMALLGLISPLPAPRERQRLIQVTHAVTINSPDFRFLHEYCSLQEISHAGTLIAVDGDRPVVTPYDRCVLIMPSQRLVPGQTAVRLGREVEEN